MAYRKQYRGLDGRMTNCATWSCKVRAPNGRVHEIPLKTSVRRDAEAIEAKIKRLLSLRMAGEPMDPVLARWLREQAHHHLVNKLAEAGIVEPIASDRARPLKELVERHLTYLNMQRRSAATVDRARRVLTGLREHGNLYLAEHMTPERIEAYLAHAIGPKDKGGLGLAVGTRDLHLNTIRSFGSWLVRRNILAANPGSLVAPLATEADRVRVFAPFEPEEALKLVKATDADLYSENPSGHQRALLWALAVHTGQRLGHYVAMKAEDIDWANKGEPVVLFRAESSKTKTSNRVRVFDPWITRRLRLATKNLAPAAPVFPWLTKRSVSDLLRADLERAGIPSVLPGNRIRTFHSFRATMVSLMVEAGVSPKAAQVRAGHRNINTTMKSYAHAMVKSDRAAAAALPEFQGATRVVTGA